MRRFEFHARAFRIMVLIWIELSNSLDVFIVYPNSSTNMIPSLVNDIKAISVDPSIEIISCNYSLINEEISIHPNALAIFDITNVLSYQFEISKLCEKNNLLHFQVSDSLFYSHKRTFFLSSSKNTLNETFKATLGFFNWTSGLSISSVENYSSWKLCIDSYDDKIKLFSLSSNTSIEDLIQREFMRLGSSLFYLFTNKKHSIEIQKALVSSKMLTKGAGILLIGEGSYELSIEGALGIVEKGKESVDSYEKYLAFAISEMILYLGNSSSSADSLNLLSKKCPKNYCSNEFSIINIQNGKRKIIGSIKDGYLSLNSTIIFPGNSTNTPTSQKKIIEISANDGTTNPGAEPSTVLTIYKRGLTLAISDLSTGFDILQNFQLKLNDFDCGALAFDAAFNYNCLKNDQEKLGVARIFSPASVVAYGEIANLAKLNVTIPSVGFLSYDPGPFKLY